MIDVFYTPVTLARSMVASLPKEFCPSKIVDFAAGAGHLLQAAEALWPTASIYANDWCPRTARMLRSQGKGWSVSCANFLSLRSRNQAKCCEKKGYFDLILLNPPFSQRGIKPMVWPGYPEITSGQAALFLFIALKFLAPKGYLIAILPDGCLSSARDRDGWSTLKNEYDIEVVSRNPNNVFKGVSARTSIVRLRKKAAPQLSRPALKSDELRSSSLQMIRGTVQMHSFQESESGYPLVHTSELREGIVQASQYYVEAARTICGPAVLFPRVGRVAPQKICILQRSQVVAPSDCVLGVSCVSLKEARNLRDAILREWPHFAANYRGTGAPYITIERARSVIESIRCNASQEECHQNSILQ
ncbi:hypothetical protein LMG26684_02790 [Achromobacter mucicolens]|nr:hypothetical protein LMG26684_02790 [Achromobacter mucicolens]